MGIIPNSNLRVFCIFRILTLKKNEDYAENASKIFEII